MKVKIRNNMQYGIPKGGIVNVKSEFSDCYVGEYFDDKKEKYFTVRVKKEYCTVIKELK